MCALVVEVSQSLSHINEQHGGPEADFTMLARTAASKTAVVFSRVRALHSTYANALTRSAISTPSSGATNE
eukprot:m.85796 g.85796  ORF g.85796 m.85796 type:complete len:71 (-) comp15072_c0_seq3:965-1177(-)